MFNNNYDKQQLLLFCFDEGKSDNILTFMTIRRPAKSYNDILYEARTTDSC